MKHLPFALVVILALFIQIAPAQEEELTSEQQAYLAQAEALWNSRDQQQGEIALPNGVRTWMSALRVVPEHRGRDALRDDRNLGF